MSLTDTRGLIATAVTRGYIDESYAECLSNMRDYNSRNGFTKIEYRSFPCPFVASGRDAIFAHALQQGYDWVLQIDADAAPFQETALMQLLVDAYVTIPVSDVIGAYAQLKDYPYLPTIDTGTGTWEPHFPGAGLLEVIRTGGHFFLTKTPRLRSFGHGGWFRPRTSVPLPKAFAEVDNFARMTLDGRNPLAAVPEWETLLAAARQGDPNALPATVGEDSSFCDAMKAAGGRIFVDTNLVTGHVAKQIIGPKMLSDALKAREREVRLACGVLT